MKARVKGLLALCLAMCMVLAMTTVAFGEDNSIYFGNISDENWTELTVTTVVRTVEGENSCGYRCSFYVVDKDGNYVEAANYDNTGMPYYNEEDTANFTFDEEFVKAWLGDGVNPNDYTFYMKRGTITVPNDQPQIATYDLEGRGGAEELPSDRQEPALMLKAVPNFYTVIFDTNGGSELANKRVEYGGAVLSGVTAPTKAGYAFAGWKYGDLTVTGDTLYSGLAAETVTSVTLVAQWEVSGHETIHRQRVTTVETPVTEPETTTVASPKTFDVGVAVYAGLSLLSAAGAAVVIGKKKEF